MADPVTKSLTLSSNYDEIQRVEPFVDELKDWAGFNEEIYSNMMLALSEAVTNAIVHGNKSDESKQVYIRAKLKGNTLSISIQDEGEGFNPSALADPLKEENLLKESGRGVYLIEQFSDDVTYSEGGTKITIEFDVSGG